MNYQEIIRDIGKRKIIELAKTFLDIIDELKKEEVAKISNLLAVAENNGLGEKISPLRPLLFLLDDNKKEILRKRVLDKTNDLIRELDS
jgi:hypothetical protein